MCSLRFTTNHSIKHLYFLLPTCSLAQIYHNMYSLHGYVHSRHWLTTCSAQRRVWRLDAYHQYGHWNPCVQKERKLDFNSTCSLLNKLLVPSNSKGLQSIQCIVTHVIKAFICIPRDGNVIKLGSVSKKQIPLAIAYNLLGIFTTL